MFFNARVVSTTTWLRRNSNRRLRRLNKRVAAALSLQQRVAAEIERLIAQGHIERLQHCTDDQIISPVVITIKRDGSPKLALDSKELNKMVYKNKCHRLRILWIVLRTSFIASAAELFGS